MGFFSWNTCDTNESIANIHSGHVNSTKPVYLLQPNGKEPLVEDYYEGYGDFGGIDAYVWIAENNLQKALLEKYKDDEDKLREFGLALEMGTYYEDINNGRKFGFHYTDLVDEIEHFGGTFDYVIPEYGKSANELIKEGTFVKKSLREFICDYNHPLKLSYNKDAKYEDFEGSTHCEYQGYFY